MGREVSETLEGVPRRVLSPADALRGAELLGRLGAAILAFCSMSAPPRRLPGARFGREKGVNFALFGAG